MKPNTSLLLLALPLSKLIRYEHQIKHINDPVPVHVSLGLVGAEGLGNQCQVKDIHHPIAVDICWILRFHPQIHLPVEVRQRVLGVHQTAGDALRFFRQGDYLEGAAVIVDRPAVGVFADVKARRCHRRRVWLWSRRGAQGRRPRSRTSSARDPRPS